MKSIIAGALCFAAGMLAVAVYRDSFGMRTSAQSGVIGNQPDPVRLERFLRRYYAWPTDVVSVKIGPFTAGPMAGFVETKVEAGPKNGNGQGVTQSFIVSNDGKFLLESKPLRVDSDPFSVVRDQIDIRNQPAFGSALPKITIVEYGDLQCSYCKTVVDVIRKDIPRDFGREVRIVFKDFPLWEIHPWAYDAAAIGRCIYKQKAEAFWDYHDWAYEQQGRLGADQFKVQAMNFAAAKKLDATKIAACLADPDTKAEVERSRQEGRALGVTGTPAFFINGRKVEGSQSYSAMKQYIQSELEYLNSK